MDVQKLTASKDTSIHATSVSASQNGFHSTSHHMILFAIQEYAKVSPGIGGQREEKISRPNRLVHPLLQEEIDDSVVLLGQVVQLGFSNHEVPPIEVGLEDSSVLRAHE